MSTKNGFFLMESMISLFCLTFFIVLFAKFFVCIISQELKARSQLQLLSIAQYNMEKMWSGQSNILYDLNKYHCELIELPLPISGITLPKDTDRYSYNMLVVKTKGDKQISVQLPGYMYATD